MLSRLLQLLAACGAVLLAHTSTAAELYHEPYRPQYHFTPARNWTNDPNGLLYANGEFHLFFQYNPLGDKWGHMSWGHAVSPDLLHWKELPVAIPEQETSKTMIFSGSAVARDGARRTFLPEMPDPSNHKQIVAIYSAHGPEHQAQAIAFSNDNGRTFQQYPGNPVLDLHKRDFRDPKVFWHEPSKAWVMVVSLSPEHIYQFYSSPDLIHWTHLSDFGPAGDATMIWECPDLFQLPVEGRLGEKHWVLMGSVGKTMQYWVGNFDGTRFQNTNTTDTVLRVDYGPDYFAAITFNDTPEDFSKIAGMSMSSDPRSNDPPPTGSKVSLGWMNNWAYANDAPTHPWRGGFSLPRYLSLVETSDGLRLKQRPAVQPPVHQSATYQVGSTFRTNFGTWDGSYEVDAILRPHSSACGFRVAAGEAVSSGTREETLVRFDPHRRELTVDRTHSGRVDFSNDFPKIYTAPCDVDAKGQVRLRIFVDRGSIEVFAGDTTVLTALIYPSEKSTGVEFIRDGEDAEAYSAEIKIFESTWR